MKNSFIEASYPIDFRVNDAKTLGKYLRDRQSVDLVGMKRVGISNFLRFFLYHKDIVNTYINHGEKHIFIPVDLNDLIERELFPFWTLTFKRIVDRVEDSSLKNQSKSLISRLFLEAIQSEDIFLTVEGIRGSLVEIVRLGYFPTIFFIRFDRLKDTVTPEFLDNLQGLRDATDQKLSYVFTSFRTLNELVPSVFKKEALSVFSQSMYVKPAKNKDIAIIFNTFKKRYQLSIREKTYKKILKLSGGHVQYLQLSLILLKELIGDLKEKEEGIENIILQDERINLQSEELWENLGDYEKTVLLKVNKTQPISKEEKIKGKYLWETGFVLERYFRRGLFSPLFDYYLKQKEERNYPEENGLEFTKKEHTLFSFLEKNVGCICEREKIIEAVWPEVEALGVSDWSIDRLVARVRNKLKKQKSPYEVVTVRTRGYKLIEQT